MDEPNAVELADSILRTYEAVIATGEAVQRHAEETESEVARIWRAIADLRDENHEGLAALSNRLQNLTVERKSKVEAWCDGIDEIASKSRAAALIHAENITDCATCEGSGVWDGETCRACLGYGKVVAA